MCVCSHMCLSHSIKGASPSSPGSCPSQARPLRLPRVTFEPQLFLTYLSSLAELAHSIGWNARSVKKDVEHKTYIKPGAFSETKMGLTIFQGTFCSSYDIKSMSNWSSVREYSSSNPSTSTKHYNVMYCTYFWLILNYSCVTFSSSMLRKVLTHS